MLVGRQNIGATLANSGGPLKLKIEIPLWSSTPIYKINEIRISKSLLNVFIVA